MSKDRATNQEAVLAAIGNGPASLKEIEEATGLHANTVASIMRYLQDHDIVVCVGKSTGTNGRPIRLYGPYKHQKKVVKPQIPSTYDEDIRIAQKPTYPQYRWHSKGPW